MSSENTDSKLARVRKMGGRVTTVSDFLGLTIEDRAYIEMRLALSRQVRESRKAAGWNQTQLARKVGSDQSRIAKVEKADPSVSFDLLIRTLLALQQGPSDIASALMSIGMDSSEVHGAPPTTPARGARKKASKKKAARKVTSRRR